MKILDIKTKTNFANLYLFLNRNEASEISIEIEKLLKNEKENVVIMGEDIFGQLTKKVIIKIVE